MPLSVPEEASTRETSEADTDTRVALRPSRKGDSRKEKVKSYKRGVMDCWYFIL